MRLLLCSCLVGIGALGTVGCADTKKADTKKEKSETDAGGPTTAWTSQAYDVQSTWHNTNEPKLTKDNVGSLVELWSQPLGLTSTVTVFDSRVFTSASSGISALDADTGRPLWHAERHAGRSDRDVRGADLRRRSALHRQRFPRIRVRPEREGREGALGHADREASPVRGLLRSDHLRRCHLHRCVLRRGGRNDEERDVQGIGRVARQEDRQRPLADAHRWRERDGLRRMEHRRAGPQEQHRLRGDGQQLHGRPRSRLGFDLRPGHGDGLGQVAPAGDHGDVYTINNVAELGFGFRRQPGGVRLPGPARSSRRGRSPATCTSSIATTAA